MSWAWDLRMHGMLVNLLRCCRSFLRLLIVSRADWADWANLADLADLAEWTGLWQFLVSHAPTSQIYLAHCGMKLLQFFPPFDLSWFLIVTQLWHEMTQCTSYGSVLLPLTHLCPTTRYWSLDLVQGFCRAINSRLSWVIILNDCLYKLWLGIGISCTLSAAQFVDNQIFFYS